IRAAGRSRERRRCRATALAERLERADNNLHVDELLFECLDTRLETRICRRRRRGWHAFRGFFISGLSKRRCPHASSSISAAAGRHPKPLSNLSLAIFWLCPAFDFAVNTKGWNGPVLTRPASHLHLRCAAKKINRAVPCHHQFRALGRVGQASAAIVGPDPPIWTMCADPMALSSADPLARRHPASH